MPIDRASDAPVPPAATVTPSAVAELSALVCACSKSTSPVDVPPALAARGNRFWGDGYPGLAELVVLADATGTHDDAEIDRFFDRLGDPVVFAERPGLETETDVEREVTYARLDRLAADRRLRARYVALLRDLWATFGGTWEAGGRAQVQATASAWTSRLAAGADALDLLPENHIARREPYAQMVRRAQRLGTLRLSPSAAGGRHIVALPGSISVSADAAMLDTAVTRRRTADEIADRLRTLSDPTRLTILAQLAQAPLGVSDLARALHIAQPTASVHLRQLKDAGLVTAERYGTRNVYSALPNAVEDLLADVTQKLTQSMS